MNIEWIIGAVSIAGLLAVCLVMVYFAAVSFRWDAHRDWSEVDVEERPEESADAGTADATDATDVEPVGKGFRFWAGLGIGVFGLGATYLGWVMNLTLRQGARDPKLFWTAVMWLGVSLLILGPSWFWLASPRVRRTGTRT